MTIMVLELLPPHEPTLEALFGLWPTFLAYVLSFLYVGIYWNNHHHLFQVVHVIDGRVLWANLGLLFSLSLFPFGTAWMGETGFASLPLAIYGVILLAAALTYWVLVRTLLRIQPAESRLAEAIGQGTKGRISPLFYMVGDPVFVARGSRSRSTPWWPCSGSCLTGASSARWRGSELTHRASGADWAGCRERQGRPAGRVCLGHGARRSREANVRRNRSVSTRRSLATLRLVAVVIGCRLDQIPRWPCGHSVSGSGSPTRDRALVGCRRAQPLSGESHAARSGAVWHKPDVH